MTGEEKPRSLAVALHYDHAGVQRVTAKGHGKFAEKIIEAAREHGVPIEEDPALAAALSVLEIDQEIPPELYQAVAIIIGFILRDRVSGPR